MRPTASPAGRRAIGGSASSWPHKLKRDAGIACTADNILITSGSLQALDLVNGVFLAPRRHRRSSSRTATRAPINRLTKLGVNTVGIPLDSDGMRIDALAARARRSQAPRRAAEIHLHHPDRAEPDRHHPARGPARRNAASSRTTHGVPIFEDDCYADLIWDGKRPPALYAMSQTRQRHPHRLVLEVDRAGACASATSSRPGH